MIILRGSPALSSFREQKLLSDFNQASLPVKGVYAEYVHVVDLESELSPEEKTTLEKLLTYGPSREAREPEGTLFVVAPRPGTISPWSSKATDIAHICGLSVVKRIERAIAYYVDFNGGVTDGVLKAVKAKIHDRMTEKVFPALHLLDVLFMHDAPKKLVEVPIMTEGRNALVRADKEMGLALSPSEIDYLVESFSALKRNPTDVELYMFAEMNSEHCRHKVFGAEWTIDGEKKDLSLFQMIKNTYKMHSTNILSAYKDNAAVMNGAKRAGRYYADPKTNRYGWHEEAIPILMKVETHNHPTAISPFPGAATGSGGEIRDEGATGRGSKPKAGLTGYSVSNLKIPGYEQPWEKDFGNPSRLASPLDIMIEGPLGGAAFNNEFGRPNILGYFRTFEEEVPSSKGSEVRGYHKPIMLAGGLGNIKEEFIAKGHINPGDALIALGGPAMLIGLGGGAASSVTSGSGNEDLDFASVQRGNPEMQRRCQEVIDRCWALEKDNPISFIHDVGAGGLSNAFPELVSDGGLGGKFELRKVPNDEPDMSPYEIWSNESQERYVIAVPQEKMKTFDEICKRERCPYAVVGTAVAERELTLTDSHFGNTPVDMPLDVLLGKPPRMIRDNRSEKRPLTPTTLNSRSVAEVAKRVLANPSVADKTFLITIGDRSVTGMIARDQMVGPWQVPVADVAVTTATLDSYEGEAMSIGERAPVALISPAASARMAVAEALTNMAAARIDDMGRINLSANWMASPNYEGDGADLYEAVKSIGMELCPELGITIPVGKDSMSMSTVWEDEKGKHNVTAPISVVISAFAPVSDARKTLTPMLLQKKSRLLLVDLSHGKNRMGASIAAQVFSELGNSAPDVESAKELRAFFETVQKLNRDGKLLAYHDKSDGGLFVAALEMAFAGHTGVSLDLSALSGTDVEKLFNEELGAVIQVADEDVESVKSAFASAGLENAVKDIGTLNDSYKFIVGDYSENLSDLRAIWSDTTRRIAKLRDNPECAESEYKLKLEQDDPGITPKLTFDLQMKKDYASRPKMAILREQGINGEVEMAAAFDRAGFESVDVHMTDILSGRVSLSDFRGLVACGGFSYGDVLGAGEGWAKSILFNERARREFEAFFHRKDTFTLGVCNGCQMVSNLKDLIPGAEHWPRFVQNLSERFEARFVSLKVEETPSVLLKGMVGSVLPIAVAHGEGRAEFASREAAEACLKTGLVGLRYVDGRHDYTERYPLNPNGSPFGITGLTSKDGRALIMMPHPERVFRTVQYSWHPSDWGEDGPWMKLFRNAREFVG